MKNINYEQLLEIKNVKYANELLRFGSQYLYSNHFYTSWDIYQASYKKHVNSNHMTDIFIQA